MGVGEMPQFEQKPVHIFDGICLQQVQLVQGTAGGQRSPTNATQLELHQLPHVLVKKFWQQAQVVHPLEDAGTFGTTGTGGAQPMALIQLSYPAIE